IAECLGDAARPNVLPDEQCRRRVGFEPVGDQLQILLVEQPLDLDSQRIETRLDLGVELHQLERKGLTVLVLADERDVDDAYRAGLRQVGERWRDVSPELVARKADDHEVDGSDLLHHPLLWRLRAAGYDRPAPARTLRRGTGRRKVVTAAACS